MKIITKKPWFGKKTIGWGLSPITWQGWIVTFILLAVIVLDFSYFNINAISATIFIMALISYIIIALLTGEKPDSKQFSE